ncbi:hypothetical protein Prudu_66S000600 [Prunus dulcis]|uniref:Uncharacterized protein n=1 Tax=Prunus dulcis TaxID=3755 RepID=A0A5H2Y1W2_PRUDU|nr:hypothetical protein Prudu_66S000600 [Prunus dulcis]
MKLLHQKKGAEDRKMARWWISVHVYSLGRKTFKNVSVTQSQPEPQTGRIQGTVVSLIRIPGSHGLGVLETREANVKCTDKAESKLDVRGYRHIRRQHILKATYFCNWVPKVA